MKTLTTIFFISLGSLALSQKDRLVYQYMLHKPLLNYASSTSENDITLRAGLQKQWLGLEGAPEVGQFMFNLPMAKSSNLGVSYEGERIGVHKRNSFKLSYAYALLLNRKSKLSFSITGIANQQSSNYLGLFQTDSNDPLSNISYNVWNPNFDFGTFFHTNKFYFGLSISNLLNNRYNSETQSSERAFEPEEFIFRSQIGYDFKLNNSLNLLTSGLIQTNKAAPFNVDLNAALDFDRKFGVGISLRSVKDVVPIIYYNYKQFSISYAYSYTFSELRKTTTGSHELFLSYKIKPKKVYYTIFCPRF